MEYIAARATAADRPAMTVLTEPAPEVSTIDLIVRRAGTLYTLPVVAIEMLELIDNPRSDVRALKECLQQDPALTAKVLRVVNSSLFGLSHSVGDLNEAVSLLGIRQLKLLVLGFSLPEQLFLGIAGDQLDWYWSSTLARAVAAREVSEQLFRRSGDEAFLAGLMQDLGILVLLRELGSPYAALVSEAIAYRAELSPLEQTVLGFDHVQLTAGLMAHWKMPQVLVRAIAEPRRPQRLAKLRDEHGPLTRVLHLAELLAQLVGQHRLSVLPDLLEAGRLYCDMDKEMLNDLVSALEPKVRQLGSVLSIDATRANEYAQVLLRAHEAMSRVAESVAAPVPGIADHGGFVAADLRKSHPAAGTVSLQEVHAAVARFLERPSAKTEPYVPLVTNALAGSDGKSVRQSWTRDELAPALAATAAEPLRREREELEARLTLAVGQARSHRQPLSVVVLAVEAAANRSTPDQADAVDRLLDVACRSGAAEGAAIASSTNGRRVLLLAGRDRYEAVGTARKLVERLQQSAEPLQRAGQMAECVVAAGVASVVEPPKSFQAARLLETAQRCLAAALNGGGVKSLEVI